MTPIAMHTTMRDYAYFAPVSQSHRSDVSNYHLAAIFLILFDTVGCCDILHQCLSLWNLIYRIHKI